MTQLSKYDDPELTESEIERIVMTQLDKTGEASEDSIKALIEELNGIVISMSLFRMWRDGVFDAVYRDGDVVYSLTPMGAEMYDRLRNQDR